MLSSFCALFLASTVTAQAPSSVAVEPRTGTWCVEIASPGGLLRVALAIERGADGGWRARIEGPETIDVPEVRFEEGELLLSFPHYDATLRARAEGDGQSLAGRWSKRSSAGRIAELPFRAHRVSEAGAPACPAAPASVDAKRFAGRFAVRFSDSSDPAVALFEARPAQRAGETSLLGTFLTTTGDLRYLRGVVEADTLRLYGFDGAHAFLFSARANEKGGLAGDFWSGDRHHATWTAVRDDEARLPDAFAAVRTEPDFGLAALVFSDVEGRARSLAEPAFAGQARIVQVLGTWCPNCHDETALLAELDRRHRQRGLSIVGLAFEHTTDFERNARQVERMRARHAAAYPILLAGLADKAQAAATLPALDRVLAFPTTIFLHRDGRVRAVDSGFSGPATGAAHTEQRARYEQLIEELLSEDQPDTDATWNLLAGDVWRDERDRVLVQFASKDGARTFEAYEMLRFDRETRRDPVASGPVAISGTSLWLGDAVWHHDRRAGLFLDARDAGHRLVPGARSKIPVVDGRGHSEPEELRLALSSPDPLLRRETVYFLTLQSRDGEAAEPFDPVPVLADPDAGVRAVAAWACGLLALPAAEPALVACLAHPSAALRREAVRALVAIGTPSALAPLGALANDPDPLVRAAVPR